MLARLAPAGIAALAALAWAGVACARGGHYTFDGGTARQQAQVRVALEVSRFDWDLVPGTVTIHVHRGSNTYAMPGEIWLDSSLLASGTFAWGPIQHEYAHEVDFLLLDDAERAELNAALGGRVWSNGPESARLHSPGHASLGAERFASTLAWSYWQSPANSLRPTSKKDEAAAMPPARFRALLSRILGIPNPVPPVVTVG